MNLYRWLNVILMMGLILAFSPLGAQAGPHSPCEPYPTYHHPRGKAYGWHGAKSPGWDRHRKQFRHSYKGPGNPPAYVRHGYPGPPPVAYVAPVTPIYVQPYPQPQPVFSQPAAPGLHGQITF
jgi:hypothetical protein